MAGRPSKYTQALADRICHLISTTPSGLKKICANNPDIPSAETIRLWSHSEPFSAQYANAKLKQAHVLAEDIIDIADDDSRDELEDENGNVRFNSEFAARSRIRIDTRKWMTSKLLPKIYGDPRLLEEKIEENERLKEELRELREKLNADYKKEY